MTSNASELSEVPWPTDGTEYRAGMKDEWRVVIGNDEVHLGKADAERAWRYSRRQMGQLALVRGVVGDRVD